jgi:hypothetical protein
VPTNAVLLDTGFAIALENRADPYHERAKRQDRRLLAAGSELVLHWGIVLEIGDGYARLGRRAKGMALLERFEREAGYRVEPITDALYRDAIDLYRSRPDKEWGLTDCVSFILMEREKITEALTPDPHFRQAGFVALLLEPDPPA